VPGNNPGGFEGALQWLNFHHQLLPVDGGGGGQADRLMMPLFPVGMFDRPGSALPSRHGAGGVPPPGSPAPGRSDLPGSRRNPQRREPMPPSASDEPSPWCAAARCWGQPPVSA